MRDTYNTTMDMDLCFMTKAYEILSVHLEIGKIKYKIYVCYRPPPKDKESMQGLHKRLTELKTPVTKRRTIIFSADFNINLLAKKD